MRPSSSLDSATSPSSQRQTAIGTVTAASLSAIQSPSDITQFLTATYGQSVLKSPIGNIKSPARSPVPPGESQIGSQLQSSASLSSLTSPTKMSSYMRNIRQQMWDDLKVAAEEKRTLLDLRDRDKHFYRRSETDLDSLYDMYSSPTRRRRGKYREQRHDLMSRTNPKSAITSTSATKTATVPFKSYEFESLHPTRSRPIDRRPKRALSSLGSYPTSKSDKESGLRESVIPNYMDTPSDSDSFYSVSVQYIINNYFYIYYNIVNNRQVDNDLRDKCDSEMTAMRPQNCLQRNSVMDSTRTAEVPQIITSTT